MYSPAAGIAYVFNLIVGTGALALPNAIGHAGWLVSLILLFFLGFLSYITTTFVIESLSIANACYHYRRDKKEDLQQTSETINILTKDTEDESSPRLTRRSNDQSPLLSNVKDHDISKTDESFEIVRSIEMGEMALMFFNKGGRLLFYLCIIIYLYGDLAIYAAAVPKSMRDIACASTSCTPNNRTNSNDGTCWNDSWTRMDVYRLFLGVFTVLMAPFAYFNVQKTKYLQYFTTVLRWIAFIMMVVLAISLISRNKKQGITKNPPIFELSGIPNLFGVSVYSFMCQHSIPSLVTPISNKKRLNMLLLFDYLLIYVFYALIGMTAIFAFGPDKLQDIYTLNFQDSCEATEIIFFRYFLGSFPVFTISTNFPIITVTLANNLKALLSPYLPSNETFQRIFFPSLAVFPPIAAAFATNDVTSLVGYTGSYAGAGVQYVIPSMLVLTARRMGSEIYSESAVKNNIYKSPFYKKYWIVLMIVWTIVCLSFVTVNHVLTHH